MTCHDIVRDRRSGISRRMSTLVQGIGVPGGVSHVDRQDRVAAAACVRLLGASAGAKSTRMCCCLVCGCDAGCGLRRRVPLKFREPEEPGGGVEEARAASTRADRVHAVGHAETVAGFGRIEILQA